MKITTKKKYKYNNNNNQLDSGSHHGRTSLPSSRVLSLPGHSDDRIRLMEPPCMDYEHLANGIPISSAHLVGTGGYGSFLWLVNRSERERQEHITAFCCLKLRAECLNPAPTFIVAADRCMKVQGQPPKIIKMYGAFQNTEDFVNSCLVKTRWRCFYETIQEGKPCKGHFDVEAKGVSVEEGVKLMDVFINCLQAELSSRWPKVQIGRN